ncbi:MAG TPA: hypothetical protein VK966_06675, partial [Longimicrobiales bacterium]|nr:hypothetical protein [Longimicrobiales bacterium]
FWRLSDPSLLQPGNERRTGHYARHAWAAIFSEAPRVRGKVSWGSDLEELLIRYGPVSDRKRIREPGPAPMMLDRGPRYVEHFARNAVALVPASLMAEGIPGPALPGVRPEMERDSAPSSYAPVPASGGRRVLRPLDAQASWFPGRQPVLRVDAILPPDTATPALVSPRGLLAVLDTLGRVVARVEPSLSLRGDSLLLSGEVPVPSGPLVYRAEVHDDSTGTGGLIQAAVEVPRSAGLRLSDLLVAHAFGDTLPGGRDQHVQPHPSLQLPRGGPVGVYAEVHGLARRGGASYEVEWSVESAEEGSLLGRAFRWVGERLGVVEAAEPVRIRWGDVSDTGMAPVALNLDLADLDPGLYRVTLTLTDRLSGAQRTTARLIRILDGPAPPSPSPD